MSKFLLSVLLTLISHMCLSQKHSFEIGYFPYSYYYDYNDFGWQGDQRVPFRNNILKYNYSINEKWKGTLSLFTMRGPMQNVIIAPENRNRYLSSTIEYLTLESSYKLLEYSRLEFSPVLGISRRYRETGFGWWVGPPFNSAGNAADIKYSAGIKIGANVKIHLPLDFHINYNIGYYKNDDHQASDIIIMYFTLGVDF